MIYEAIRSLREESGLNQTDLGKLLGIAQNTYSQYETGKIAWTDELLVSLANYYGVSIDYMLGRTKKRELNR